MKPDEIEKLLRLIMYPGYRFEVVRKGEHSFLMARYNEADVDEPGTGLQQQSTRKWYLSPHMTPSEVVQTAFKCVLTSMEHRTREHFTYRGARIFGPHLDCEALVGLARLRRPDQRAPIGGAA